MPSASRRLRKVAFTFVAVVCCGETLALGGAPIWSWVAAVLVLSVGFLICTLGTVIRAGDLPWHPVLLPAILYGALVLWQCVDGGSVFPGATRTNWLQLAAAGWVMYLAFFAASGKNVRRFGTIMWWFSGALAVLAILENFNAHGKIYWIRDASYATPVGPFIYHNHFAGAMDLLLPVSLATALYAGHAPRDTPSRLRRGLLPALALASVVISQSRGGVISLLVEGVLATLVFWPEWHASRIRIRQAASVAAALIAFAFLSAWHPLLRRLSALGYHDISSTERLRTAQACVRIWLHFPWTGSGFGTFATLYPRFESFDNGLMFINAHNEYAQCLAETGVIGVALVMLFFALFVRSQWNLCRRQSASVDEVVCKSLLVGIGGFLFHSLGDFLFHSPADLLLFFTMVGLCLRSSIPRQRIDAGVHEPQLGDRPRRRGHQSLRPQSPLVES